MPPPPPRRTRHTSTMHEDSQLTQMQSIGGSGETRSVNGETGSDVSQRRRGVDLASEATKSLQDSCIPAGFFEETRTTSKRQKRPDAEYGAFMQEMSALGAVKENKDNTVIEVSVGRGEAGARSGRERARPDDGIDHAGEPSVGGHASAEEDEQDQQEGEVDSDTEEEFHQFVRRERMQELKRAVQCRDKAALQDQQSVAVHISDITSEEGSNIRLPLQNSRSTQNQKSAAESYIHSGEESPSSSDDLRDDAFDWKSKKLT